MCPVGSEDSADWKPALAYPPFREHLLSPGPKLTPLAPPQPPPSRPVLTRTCPRCARANPQDATFCNGCAARMDGRVDPPGLAGPKRAMANAREPDPEPVFIASAPLAPPAEAEVAAEAVPAPVPAAVPAGRKALIALCVIATLGGGAFGWRVRHRAESAVTPIPEQNPAPATAPETAAASAALTPAPAVPPTVPLPAPEPTAAPEPKPAPAPAPQPTAPAKRARRKARARKTKSAPKAAPEPAETKDKALLDSLESPDDAATAAAKPAAKPAADAKPPAPAAAEESGFMMPGVPRRVTAKSVTKPKAGAAPPAEKTGAADAAGADKAAPAADDAEAGTARQVREQFTFCAQLLEQGAYADHFDTCLCADAKQAAPYLGRRGAYAAALKKSAAAGTLESSASVAGIGFDGPVAKVTADWKTGAADAPRTETETWRLEEGLWCRSP